MKILEFEKFIQNLSPDLYSFAYILIPDDLQATQLMIDSVAAFFIQKKTILEKLVQQKDNLTQTDLKAYLYKSMYDLSKKRYGQLKGSFQSAEDSTGFFSLEFDEKAVLFLREKTDFGDDLIEYIVGKTRSEILAYLYSARFKMVSELEHIHSKMSEIREINN